MILKWFAGRGEREARQLNRDAPLIIELANETLPGPRIHEVAVTTGEHIRRAHKIYGAKAIDFKRAIQDYRGLHKDARRNNDQMALSAMTLVIIYLRAEIVGPAADPARAAIDEFIGASENSPHTET